MTMPPATTTQLGTQTLTPAQQAAIAADLGQQSINTTTSLERITNPQDAQGMTGALTAGQQQAAQQLPPANPPMAQPSGAGGEDTYVTVPVDKVVVSAGGQGKVAPLYANAQGYRENPAPQIPPTVKVGRP